MRDKRFFTTGEVATIIGVTTRTIANLFDAGLIKGYRIPLSNDRRIPRSSLEVFMKERGISLECLPLLEGEVTERKSECPHCNRELTLLIREIDFKIV